MTDRFDDVAPVLRPGDVVLFEKSLRASSFIAFADLRPVSHAAVVVQAGDDPVLVDATLPSGAERAAVDRTPLRALLARRHRDARGTVPAVRVVTIRRARAAVDRPDLGEAVAVQAERLVRVGSYGLVDMATLGPHAFARSSGDQAGAGFAAALRGLLGAARACVRLASGGAEPRVTCAELVYRCLAAVPEGPGTLAPEVTAPLVVDGRLRTDWPVLDGAGSGDRGLDLELADVAADLRAFSDDWASAKASPVVAVDGAVDGAVDRAGPSAPVERGGLSPGSIVARLQEASRLDVADGVTPGDLLGSPSLVTVAVLHHARW